MKEALYRQKQRRIDLNFWRNQLTLKRRGNEGSSLAFIAR